MSDLPTLAPTPLSVYAERRARVAQAIGPNGIAIVPTAPERQRNRDSDFLYRHDSYFYYLTGFTEANAWLVITGDGHSTLWCNPKDLEREIWDGYRLGPDAAPAALGVDTAWPVTELDTRLPKLLENRDVVHYPFATHKGLETRVDGWLGQVRARVRFGALCPAMQRDLCGVLDEMRLIKDGHELAIMLHGAHMGAPCSSAPAACAPARRCANTTWTPNCCTSSAAMARSTRPTAPSWPPGPMPACCTTAPIPRRCVTASWC